MIIFYICGFDYVGSIIKIAFFSSWYSFRRLKKSEGFICALNKEDLSEKWILRLKDEFEKLETEKFAKITELVQVCREEIANLWEKMYFNQVYKQSSLF